jgi:hypothetical protein
MNRLSELLLKWQDRSITEQELRELNSILREPDNRRALLESFSFDSELIQALESLKAVQQTAQSAQQFQTIELQDADRFAPVTQSQWHRKLRALFLPVWALSHGKRVALGAAAILIVLLSLVTLFGRPTNLAVLETSGGGVTILRGSVALVAKPGSRLKSGDRLKTSGDNGALIRYLNETTQIKLQPGTQLKLDQEIGGKRLELLMGNISVKVAPQPVGRPMMIATPHSEAKVRGTEFLLAVDSASTHLEVIEGAVQIVSREDGKAVEVHRDHFATVAKGVELVSRSLLPPPWNSQDIGAVGMTGYARIEGHRCKIKGAGKTDTASKDQFHFLYQKLESDGEIRARVVDVEHYPHHLAKAGVLIRDNLKPNSPQAFLYLKAGSGIEFEQRVQSESTINWGGNDSAPSWLRLAKGGEWIRAYKSADGVEWTEIGAVRIKMRGKIFVGLGVSSGNNSKLTTSVFDNVNVIAATNILATASSK